MSGHIAIKKTMDRVLTEFFFFFFFFFFGFFLFCFWPGVCGDLSRFCISCDICQRVFRDVVSIKSL